MQLDILVPPKLKPDGCYDVEEVLAFVAIVGDANAAKTLRLPLHRIVFFMHKAKEPKRVNTSIHSLR